MFDIGLAQTTRDLEQIIALQRANHPKVVDPALWDSQGFVTMEYTVAQLELMQGPYRHVVARGAGGDVAGYALVMLPEHQAEFPFLAPMFDGLAAATVDGRPASALRWFAMGQVCVAEALRGQGVFRAMYHGLRAQMRGEFDFVGTEVSRKNPRSMAAHHSVGFQEVAGGSDWQIIVWNWSG